MLSIPKILRLYFLYDRKLLSDLSRCGWEALKVFYTTGGGFNWDIFNYGRITNQVRVEDARFQELAVNYEDTVIRAAQDVEDAMVSFLQSQDAVFFLADAVKASKRSVDLSLIQYREGLVDYQRVLDTQRDLTTQQDNLVFTAGSVGQSLVDIYRALGGGGFLRGSFNKADPPGFKLFTDSKYQFFNQAFSKNKATTIYCGQPT